MPETDKKDISSFYDAKPDLSTFYDKPQGLIERMANPPGSSVINAFPEEEKVKSFGDVTKHLLRGGIHVVRPLANFAAGGAGATAGGLVSGGNPIAAAGAGVAGYTLADQTIQKLLESLGEKPEQSWTSQQFPNAVPKGSIGDSLAQTGELGLINEGGSQIIGKLGSMFKAFRENPIDRYDAAVAAQKAQFEADKLARTTDLETRNAAREANVKSASEATYKIENQGAKRQADTIATGDPNAIASTLQENLTKGEAESVAKSNFQAKAAKSIAQQNVVKFKVKVGEEVSPIKGPNGEDIVQPKYEDRIVEGPINPVRATAFAQRYIDEQKKFYGAESTAELIKIVEDEKKPLVATMNDILKADGNPIPFQVAWDAQKAAANIGHEGPGISYKKAQFNNLSDALKGDIRESLPQWQNGDAALQHWENSKNIANLRHETYDAGILKRLKTAPDTPSAQVDQLLRNPEAIGKMRGAGVDITPLKAYGFRDLVDNSIRKDGSFDPLKLAQLRGDPEMQASYSKLYNKQEMANIDSWISTVKGIEDPKTRAARITSSLPPITAPEIPKPGEIPDPYSGAASYFKGRGYYGTSIGAGLYLSGHALGLPHTEVAGAVLGVSVLGKLITSPRTAQAMKVLFSADQSSPEAKFAARLVMGTLNHMVITLKNRDGSEKQATIEDGQIKY